MEPSRRRRALATAAALLAAVPAAVFATISADASVPPTPPGWTLQWSDDFTGAANTLPSGANWIFDLGHSYPGGPANWGTGEIQNYTNSTSNIRLDGNGNLRITALRDGAGNWTSARIETQRANFRPPAGGKLAIEGRIQMPNVTGSAALGYWPAFWALGSPYRGNYWNWPAIGEFDIMENVNGINSVWGVLHCGVNPGGPCNETNGLGASRACPGSTCQSAFHTYRFEWDESVSPKQFRWYVDGQQYHSVNQSQFDATTWNNMTGHAGYFILLNLAMGGAFPNGVAGHGTPTAATVPGHSMVVDYVAVWTAGGGTTPPTTTTTTPPGGSGWDAYAEIQAEQATSRSGGVVEACSEGGQDVGQLKNGDRLRFSGVRFGSGTARQFIARAASGAAGGVSGLVEVRLDSPTATPIGSFAIANTGGWQSWRTVPANISGVTGTHDVYITFTSGQPAAYVSVNWLKFGV
ncbi:carbohydrate-binding protein [Actinosynnema sp. CA-248983]